MRGDLGGVFSSVMGVGKKIMNQNSGAAERTKQANTSAADVIQWSGCKDSQVRAIVLRACMSGLLADASCAGRRVRMLPRLAKRPEP